MNKRYNVSICIEYRRLEKSSEKIGIEKKIVYEELVELRKKLKDFK